MYAPRKLVSTAGAGGRQQTQGTSKVIYTDSQTTEADQMSQGEEGSSDMDEEEEYGDMHRLVLQGVIAAGYLDAKGVKKLFQGACEYLRCKTPEQEHMTPPYIQKVVREINERIKHYDMMIRSATCEITGEKFYVFLITIEKQIMKMQTYFQKVELTFFQKVLDSLLLKHRNFAISMAECINIAAELDCRVFTKVHAEDFIEKMVILKYLSKVFKDDKVKKEFEITLGFRTIREFEPIFRDTYTDCFGTCCLCKTIMLNGLQCPKCTAVIHKSCLKRYLKNSKVCVSCKALWKNENALSVRTKDGFGDPSQKSIQDAGGSGQTRRFRSVNISDEVDMPVLEPMVSPRSAGTSQSSQRPKKNKEFPRTQLSKQGIKDSTKSSKKITPTPKRRPRRVSSSDSQ